MHRRLLSLATAVMFWVTSCRAQATLVATSHPAPLSTPTISVTAPASSTIEPTTTPTPTLIKKTSTKTPSPTPSQNLTAYWALPSAIAGAAQTASPPRLDRTYRSPDGQWQVEIWIHDCVKIDSRLSVEPAGLQVLKLRQRASQTEWVIDSQGLACVVGLGAGGLDGRFWSPNSRYFYYTTASGGVPDGVACNWQRPLVRLDVVSREADLFPGGSFSPDRTQLAAWGENGLLIWRLDGGEPASVPSLMPEAVRSVIAWSPDSQSLAYLLTASECQPVKRSWVVRVDRPDFGQTLVLDSATPSFGGLVWDAPNRLKLFSEDSRVWSYNFVTQTLRPLQ